MGRRGRAGIVMSLVMTAVALGSCPPTRAAEAPDLWRCALSYDEYSMAFSQQSVAGSGTCASPDGVVSEATLSSSTFPGALFGCPSSVNAWLTSAAGTLNVRWGARTPMGGPTDVVRSVPTPYADAGQFSDSYGLIFRGWYTSAALLECHPSPSIGGSSERQSNGHIVFVFELRDEYG